MPSPAAFLRAFKRRHRLQKARAELAARDLQGAPHGLESPLVVSLTSYPARYDILALTLKGLLHQSTRADLTILWIAHDHMDNLPKDVLALRGPEFEIRAVDDLRSYKKILPAVEAFPDATIVTADDDIYYTGDWLQRLAAAYLSGASGVVCHRAHKIRTGSDGLPLAYTDWQVNTADQGPNPLLFPTGCSGVLYAPGSLGDEIGNRRLIAQLCPQADDIWLYWMHRLAGHAARKIGPPVRILEWQDAGHETLRNYNLAQGGNDQQIRAMIAHFGWPGEVVR